MAQITRGEKGIINALLPERWSIYGALCSSPGMHGYIVFVLLAVWYLRMS